MSEEAEDLKDMTWKACISSFPQEKMTVRFSVRLKKTVQEKHPSDVKQCKTLQDFEQRVGV